MIPEQALNALQITVSPDPVACDFFRAGCHFPHPKDGESGTLVPYRFCTGAATVYQRHPRHRPDRATGASAARLRSIFRVLNAGHRADPSCPSLNAQAPPVLSTCMRTVRQDRFVLVAPCCAFSSFFNLRGYIRTFQRRCKNH